MTPAPLNVGDLTPTADEPRILDVRVGERLGMAQPLNIRAVIENNRAELEGYGSIHAARELIEHGKGGQREITAYYLNEPQTLLLCMFSRTARAAEVRREVIAVYMAYRRGPSATTAGSDDGWDGLSRRQAILRQAAQFQEETESPAFAKMLAHRPRPGRWRRQPAFWGDFAVRQALIDLHRQVTLDVARQVLTEKFGPARTPGRSTIGRFWCELDRTCWPAAVPSPEKA